MTTSPINLQNNSMNNKINVIDNRLRENPSFKCASLKGYIRIQSIH